jgi:hypothetical protein
MNHESTNKFANLINTVKILVLSPRKRQIKQIGSQFCLHLYYLPLPLSAQSTLKPSL